MTIEVTPVATAAPDTVTIAPASEPETPPTADAATPEPDAKVEDAAPKDTKVAARFAELARRDAAIARREQALKASEAELTAYKSARESAKKDPRAALKALGISLQELVDAELKDGMPETVEDRVARLEREKAEDAASRKQADEERTKGQIAATIDRARRDIRTFVDADPDKYELVISEGAHGEVFETISAMYEATAKEAAAGKRDAPVLLSYEQAADMVEEHLLERARRLSTSKKLAPAAPPPAPAPAAPGKRPSPTITAARSSAPAATPPAPTAGLTRRQRIELAAQKLRFKDG